MFERILVVCTGNICRSPIAEGLLRQRFASKAISSAGTGAVVGAGADPYSIAACADHELDIRSHRARQVGLLDLQQNELVLTLDESHSAWLNHRYPQFRGKVHKLGKWRQNQDVQDPYGQSRAAFEQCYLHIESLIQDWAKRL